MSTMAATNAMHASGVNQKKGRSRIDQAAAVHILQGWLDARKAFFARHDGSDNDS
jgi:putative Holliday junction resolvase